MEEVRFEVLYKDTVAAEVEMHPKKTYFCTGNGFGFDKIFFKDIYTG